MSFAKNVSLARMIDDYLPRGGHSPTTLTDLPDEVREMAGWVVPVCVVGVVFLVAVVVVVLLAAWRPEALHHAGAFFGGLEACCTTLILAIRGPAPPAAAPAPPPPPPRPFVADQPEVVRARWLAGRAIDESVHLYSVPASGSIV